MPKLFPEIDDTHRNAVARRSDPESSHDTAAAVNKSDLIETHCKWIRYYVSNHPGSTAGEIAAAAPEHMRLDNAAVTRRFGDVSDDIRYGERRKCTVKGSTMSTWWPRET